MDKLIPAKDPQILNEHENWVSLEVAKNILQLTNTEYVSKAIRKGVFKGKVGFRSFTGRNYKYYLPDLLKLKEQMTVPAKRI